MNPRLWLPLILSLLVAPPASADAPKRLTLPNDLRVIIRSNWSTEIVAVDMLFDISVLDEPQGKHGLRHLLQRLLLRGSQRQNGDAMGRSLASVGGVADTTVGLDYVEVYLLVPADGFEAAIALLAEAVRSPALRPGDIADEIAAAQNASRAARDDPFQETYLAFREALYGDHPYGLPTFGTPRSLAAITREDLVTLHQRHYRPNNAVLAICGGVGEARALRAVRAAFADWAPLPPSPRPSRSVPPLSSSVVAAREIPSRRAHLILGFPAPAADAPEYYTVQVIDSLLSGGASSRLPQRIREDLGLVYHVSSFYPTLSHQSHLAVYAVTPPSHLPAVKDAILEELSRLAREPVPPDELGHAKRYLLGSYTLSHQRMKDQAYALAWYETLGLGPDFEQRYSAGVQAVTPAQVQQTARTILSRFALAAAMPTS